MSITKKLIMYLINPKLLIFTVITFWNVDGVISYGHQKSVLVFGGNGFVGAATVESLLRENANVVMVNRGNWYWDSETRIKPYVRHLSCDRKKPLIYCEDMMEYLDIEDDVDKFDYVIDFSGFRGKQVRDVMETFEGRIKRYIYISSDSVYEVCQKNHSNPTTEEDAVRPFNTEEKEVYATKDDYGNGKLEGEEELRRQEENGGVPYIALRMPDVIGPRDTTYRWWLYQMWIQLWDHLDRKLTVPRKLLNRPISLVYVDDVAKLISDFVFERINGDIYNHAFNLAIDGEYSLATLLIDLIRELKSDSGLDILENDDSDGLRFYPPEKLREVYSFDNTVPDYGKSLYFFPSVTQGPIDINKAKMMLNWKPTPWGEVLKKTAAFYESAVKEEKFPAEFNDIITTLKTHFVKDEQKVIDGLDKKYNIKINRNNTEFSGRRDEL